MNTRIERQIDRRIEQRIAQRIDWRLALGFFIAWIGATGALVAADIAASPTPAVQVPQADRMAA